MKASLPPQAATEQTSLKAQGASTFALTPSPANTRSLQLQAQAERMHASPQMTSLQSTAQRMAASQVAQLAKIGELLKPVGPRLAAKHVYNNQGIFKFKDRRKEDIQSDENMEIHKHNAEQAGRIAGRRASDSRNTPNTVLNVTVADLATHLKTDHQNTDFNNHDRLDTRNYKFASAIAHNTIMAFGGVQNGTAEIEVHGSNNNARFDHLQKTTPATQLNPNSLGKQDGGWLVTKNLFTDDHWSELLAARDAGFTDGEGAATTAETDSEQ